jgi:uncharacterized damage-inducible protein DinB
VHSHEIQALFDYNDWANRQILDVVDGIPPEQFTALTTITWRNLRDTLVHIYDVERSWRERIRGADRAVWDSELPVQDFPTPAKLREAWDRDMAVTREWLSALDDAAVAAVADLGERDRFPLWITLVHIVTHGIEQRRDAATLLRNYGHTVPDLEFLWYADTLGGQAGG